jgi:hypothetical protein
MFSTISSDEAPRSKLWGMRRRRINLHKSTRRKRLNLYRHILTLCAYPTGTSSKGATALIKTLSQRGIPLLFSQEGVIW